MRNKLGLNYWVLGGFEGALGASEAIDLTAAWNLDCLELTVPDLLPTDLSSSQGSRILHRSASRPVTPYGEVWKHTAESIGELEPVAARAGVTLCIENVWNQFLLSPMEMQIFVDLFASEYVGVYFDVGNVRPWGHPEHWIDLLRSRVKAVHIKNFEMSDGLGGLHGFTDDLARGDVDFEAFRGALERTSYEGPLIAEMIPFRRLPDLGLPDRVLAEKTAGELRRLFG